MDKAEVIFYNGLHLEGQMLDIFEQMGKDKTVLAVGETLDTKQLLASDSDAMLHDPHIWFDIELWKGVVQAISLQLQEEYPEFKEDFQQNEMSYLKKLDDLQSYAKNESKKFHSSKGF